MSHQTGIKANEALKKFFGKCKDGKIRAFKVSIENEQLSLIKSEKVSKTWEKDFNTIVPGFIEDDEPCYILYRLDTKHSSGYHWLLISWCPDSASVRQKMLYASTKSTLKQEFGTGDIQDELHGTVKEEISIRGYQEHKRNAQAPAPLTNREEELLELKKSELASASTVGVDTKHQTMSGVAFPIDPQAQKALLDLKDFKIDYVQLKIEIEAERIVLADACKLKIQDLKEKIPKEGARYHLYNFKHTYEGDYMEKFVFIYSMPGYSCSIKERMLYSSCKAFVLQRLQDFGLEIEKKLEIDADDEVNDEFLMDEVHPKMNLYRPKFEKPKGPPNRGARRITKPQENNN